MTAMSYKLAVQVNRHPGMMNNPLFQIANQSSRGIPFQGFGELVRKPSEQAVFLYYVDIKSRLEEEKRGNQDLLQYWVGGTGFVQTRKGNRQKEAFQKEIDDKLSDYMRGIEKAPYYSDIRAVRRLLERARDLGKRIDLVLRLNLEVAIFSDCEYTTAME